MLSDSDSEAEEQTQSPAVAVTPATPAPDTPQAETLAAEVSQEPESLETEQEGVSSTTASVPATPVEQAESVASSVPHLEIQSVESPVAASPASALPAADTPVSALPAADTPVSALPVVETPVSAEPQAPTPVSEVAAQSVPASPLVVSVADQQAAQPSSNGASTEVAQDSPLPGTPAAVAAADLVDVNEIEGSYSTLLEKLEAVAQPTADTLFSGTKKLVVAITPLLSLSSRLADLEAESNIVRNLSITAEALRESMREFLTVVKGVSVKDFATHKESVQSMLEALANAAKNVYQAMKDSPLLHPEIPTIITTAETPEMPALSVTVPTPSGLSPSMISSIPPTPLSPFSRDLIGDDKYADSKSEIDRLRLIVGALLQSNKQLETARSTLSSDLQIAEASRLEAEHSCEVLLGRLEKFGAEDSPTHARNDALEQLIEENSSLSASLKESEEAIETLSSRIRELTASEDGAPVSSAQSDSELLSENEKLKATCTELAMRVAELESESMQQYSRVADDRIEQLWETERADLLAQMETLRGSVGSQDSLNTADAGEVESLRASLAAEVALRESLEQELAEGRTTTSWPSTEVVSLDQYEKEKKQWAAEAELLRTANRRLEVSRHEIVKALSDKGETAKLQTVLGKDFRRFFSEVSPCTGLSGILAFYRRRLAEVDEKQQAVTTAEASADLRVLADYYKQSIAEIEPHAASLALVEQRVVEVIENQRRQERAMTTLRGESELKERRIDQLQTDVSKLHEELDEWRSVAGKLQQEKYQLQGKLVDTQRVGVHAREMLDRLRSTPVSSQNNLSAELDGRRGRSGSQSSIMSTASDSSISMTPAQRAPPMDEGAAVVLIQKVFRGFAARALLKNAVRRRHIVREIYDTEKSYVGYLHVLVDNYRETFSRKVGSVLTKDQFETLFYHVVEIRDFNKRLLVELEDRVNNWQAWQVIGDTFIKLGGQLDTCYTEYVNNYNKALVTLNECRQRDQFRALMNDIKEKQGRRSLALPDLLIMPIQRVVRYSLLLQELFKRTSPRHPDYAKLQHAVIVIKAAADSINEKKGQVEKFQAVIDISQRLTGLPRSMEPLVRGQDRFVVKEGELCEMVSASPKERRVVLFNDLFFCAKLVNRHNVATTDYEFKWAYPLSSLVEVTALKADTAETYNRDVRQRFKCCLCFCVAIFQFHSIYLPIFRIY